jgi:DNA polymerase-4
MRSNDLSWFERQMKLPTPSHITSELCSAGMRLLRDNYQWEKPLRSIGIRGTDLVPIDSERQTIMFCDERQREKMENLEFTIDDIRRRFGHHAIIPGLLYVDDMLGKLNPKDDHTIHPVGYY